MGTNKIIKNYLIVRRGYKMGKRGEERSQEQNKEYGRQGKYAKGNQSEEKDKSNKDS
ncbi:hypothetical protein [Geomicrobium sp. JCM 19055]|uniref:hypothetical protein n=1 Tax=Geomicrobium sp. JCM 19055 TaxID=1460649 RepID=UPI00187CEEE9|nr:hypothetical protein [Geomicrobium sp. JCM 19055]